MRYLVTPALLIACSTPTGGTDGGAGADGSAECIGRTPITSKEEFVAVAMDEPLQVADQFLHHRLGVSGDLFVEGPLTIDAMDLPPVESCQTVCDPRRFFLVPPDTVSTHGSTAPIGGVRCDETTQVGGLTVCRRVTLQAATFRVRNLLVFVGELTQAPVVELVSGCEAACPEGELRCESDQTCWPVKGAFDTSYCRLCLGERRAVCACLSPDGQEMKADGEGCFYASSSDYVCGGSCQAGLCSSASSPALCD